MKKQTKLLVLLLSVALVLAGLVIAVSADTSTPGATYVDANDEPQTTDTLETAFANAKDGTTITLTGDTTSETRIEVKKNITLNLNGYTLSAPDTRDVMFLADTANTTFTITGDGAINLPGVLVQNSTTVEGLTVNVSGEAKGITITHTGIRYPSFMYMTSGTYNFKNLNITGNTETKANANIGATAKQQPFFWIPAASTNPVVMNFAGCKMEVTSTKGDYAVIRMRANSEVTVDYCNIKAIKGAIFNIESHSTENDKLLTVNDSLLHTGTYGNSATSVVYIPANSEGKSILGSNLYFNDTNVTYSQPIPITENANGSAIILNNSTFISSGGSGSSKTQSAWAFFAVNVKLLNGSALSLSHSAYSKIPGPLYKSETHDTIETNPGSLTVGEGENAVEANLVLYEGARVNYNVYNAIVTKKYDQRVVFEDGSSPSTSTTYKFVQDYAKDGTLRYTVINIANPDTLVSYWKNNLSATQTWNAPTGATADVTGNKNGLWHYTSNGKKGVNTAGKAADPEVLFYNPAGIDTYKYNVLTLDFDIGTLAEKFMKLSFRLQNTNTAGAYNSGSKTNNTIFNIDSNKIYVNSKAVYDLDASASTHVSIVIDTSNQTAYVYIEGNYVGSVKGYTYQYFYGPRVVLNGEDELGAGITMDNLSIRAVDVLTDGETATKIDRYGIDYLPRGFNPVDDDITIAGMNFDGTLSDAIAVSEELGIIPGINKDLNSELFKVESNGKINANGYKITVPDGSYSFDTIVKDGVIEQYVFDESYSAYSVTYKWYVGNIDSEIQKLDESKWVSVTYNPGDVFADYAGEVNPYLVEKGYDYKFADHNGWNIPVGTVDSYVTVDTAMNNDVVEIYPTFDMENPHVIADYFYVVLDSDGYFDRGGKIDTNDFYGSRWGSSYANLKSGETFVFLYDYDLKGQVTPTEASSEGVWNIDLNGRKINYLPYKQSTNKADPLILAKAGQTYNVYSSEPGATITINSYARNDKEYASGGNLFRIRTGREDITSTLENTDNAAINVGTMEVFGTKVEGSNITVNCDVLFVGETGDTSCKFNADGITVVRTSKNYVPFNGDNNTFSFITIARYSGEINVKNSNLIIAAGGNIIGCVRWWCWTGETEYTTTGSGSKDKIVSTTSKTVCEALFENTNIIFPSNGDNMMASSDQGFETISFNNVTTNGRLNSQNSFVRIGEGTATATTNAGKVSSEELERVSYNLPMTLSGIASGDTIAVKVIADTTGTDFTTKDYVIAANGYSANEGETVDLTLSVLGYKVVKKVDILEVTYIDAATGKDTTVKYANGGIFTHDATEGVIYNGQFITSATFDGTYSVNGEVVSLPMTVTESVTLTPNYKDITYDFAKPQVNLSLAADFSINLYVSVDYKNYVDSIVESGVAPLKATEVDTNEDGVADYIMVTIAKKATEATDDAVFTINLKDGPLTVTETATISIAAYAEKILDGAYDADDKALMYYILNYTKEAETYFDKAADAEALENIAKKYTGKTVAIDHNYVALDTSKFAGTIAEATVVLEDVPKFKFTLASGFTGNVTITDGKNERGSFDITADGSKEIVIDTIKAYNFDKTLYIKVTPTAEEGKEAVTTTYEYNLATFAAYHTAQAAKGNAKSQAALNVIGALYDYAKVAYMYKTGTLAAAVTE